MRLADERGAHNLPQAGVSLHSRLSRIRRARPMKKRSSIGLLLASIFCTASAQTPSAPASGWPESWIRPIAPFRIVGDVYYVGTAGLASYLIATPQGHVLLDGGL